MIVAQSLRSPLCCTLQVVQNIVVKLQSLLWWKKIDNTESFLDMIFPLKPIQMKVCNFIMLFYDYIYHILLSKQPSIFETFCTSLIECISLSMSPEKRKDVFTFLSFSSTETLLINIYLLWGNTNVFTITWKQWANIPDRAASTGLKMMFTNDFKFRHFVFKHFDDTTDWS